LRDWSWDRCCRSQREAFGVQGVPPKESWRVPRGSGENRLDEVPEPGIDQSADAIRVRVSLPGMTSGTIVGCEGGDIFGEIGQSL
jgi:hypothetical protein